MFSPNRRLLLCLAVSFLPGSVFAQVSIPAAPAAPEAGIPIEPAVAADFALGAEAVLDRYIASQRELEAELSSILAIPDDQRSFANTIKALETATARHDDVVRPMEILGNVSTDPKVRMASKLVEDDNGEYATRLWSRKDLYRAVAAYAAKGEALTGEDKLLLETITAIFEDSGIHLPASQGKRFTEIQEKLASLAAKFQSNIDNYEGGLDLTRQELKGLPQDHVDRLERTSDGKYRVTLEFDDYDAFLKHADSAALRQKLELMYHTRVSENTPILAEMLRLRDESAKLMGYPTYADWELSGNRLTHSPKEVFELLNRVWNGIRGKAEAELKALLELKRRDEPSAQTIESYDRDYYLEKLKKERYDFDNE
jgi:thimet oligopeptidase